MNSPADKLTPAEPKDRIPDLLEAVLSSPDWVSPSHWFLKAVGMICHGKNPAEESAEAIAGDWNGLAKSADGLRKLADFYDETAKDLAQSNEAVMKDWGGNAADAAAAYFEHLSRSIQAQAQPIRTLAHQCDDAATSIWSLGKGLASAMEALTDYIIATAAALAAGAVTAETGIGALLGGGAAIYTVWRRSQKWLEIADIISKIHTIAFTFSGTVNGLVSDLSKMDGVAYPKGAYDDPQA